MLVFIIHKKQPTVKKDIVKVKKLPPPQKTREQTERETLNRQIRELLAEELEDEVVATALRC